VTSFMSRVKEYIGIRCTPRSRVYLEAHPISLPIYLNRNVALLEIIRVDREGIVISERLREREVPYSQPLYHSTIELVHSGPRGSVLHCTVEISAQNDPYLILATPLPTAGVVAARLRMNVSFGM
jgi:hypothetical protein